jgi:hypothetical protein
MDRDYDKLCRNEDVVPRARGPLDVSYAFEDDYECWNIFPERDRRRRDSIGRAAQRMILSSSPF